MELDLTPETEAKLNELARRTRRGADELVGEAVDHLIVYNEWFERRVHDSQAAVGETVPDDAMRTWIERRERSQPISLLQSITCRLTRAG